MHQSITSALTHVREQTAGPDRGWQRATVTNVSSLDAPDTLDDPSRLVLTATTQDGTALVWEFSLDGSADDALLSHLTTAAGGDAALDGQTVWIRQHETRSEGVPDAGQRWDRSGHWILEPPADHQRRQTLTYRLGRVFTATVLFLDLILGRWRRILQIGLLITLVVVIEPAWAIVLGGLTILACEEVALMAFRE
jgi:hypothetical protein